MQSRQNHYCILSRALHAIAEMSLLTVSTLLACASCREVEVQMGNDAGGRYRDHPHSSRQHQRWLKVFLDVMSSERVLPAVAGINRSKPGEIHAIYSIPNVQRKNPSLTQVPVEINGISRNRDQFLKTNNSDSCSYLTQLPSFLMVFHLFSLVFAPISTLFFLLLLLTSLSCVVRHDVIFYLLSA